MSFVYWRVFGSFQFRGSTQCIIYSYATNWAVMAAPTPVNLPIIDFTACNLTNKDLDLSDDDVKRVADEVVKGLEGYGAVYLINHGMSTEGVGRLKRKMFYAQYNCKVCSSTYPLRSIINIFISSLSIQPRPQRSCPRLREGISAIEVEFSIPAPNTNLHHIMHLKLDPEHLLRPA